MAGGLCYPSGRDMPPGMQAAAADKIIERFRNASSQVAAMMQQTAQPSQNADDLMNANTNSSKGSIHRNIQVIDIVGLQDKWVKLMIHFQNSTKQSPFHMTFSDKETATKIRQRMHDVISRRPEWFTLIITQRDSDVYVFNWNRVQNVEVRYD